MNVGDTIDCSCPRCKSILAHVILYFQQDGRIGKVECRTCGMQHPYRSHRAGRIRRASPPSKPLISLLEGGTHAERLSRLDATEIRPYRMEGTYGENDAIQHPRFGVGFVLSVRGDRIDVLFRDGMKTLIAKGAR